MIDNHFLQDPPIDVLPSLHSVNMASRLAWVGALAMLVGALAALAGALAALAGGLAVLACGGKLASGAAAGVAPPGAGLCTYMIFLAPLSHDPTTLPAALAVLSTTVTVKLATPAALILPSICARRASQLLAWLAVQARARRIAGGKNFNMAIGLWLELGRQQYSEAVIQVGTSLHE
jgi:hypothetical protein